MGRAVQYATEQPDAPYEIRVYPGANATFTMYEDDNETYAYEQGARATYQLAWDDAGKTLRIGAREGSFPGLVGTRELKIAVQQPGAAGSAKVVRYSGEPVDVKFSD
jgi:alpha-D-xyloside xylohydrolase